MTDKVKILVCGDVDGKFKTLFSRVETINKKNGPFEFLLCVGNFFGPSKLDWEPYQKGVTSVPITTYVLGPNSIQDQKHYDDINGCELAPNVSYVGKRGLFSGTSGLKLAYVSGIDGGKSQEGQDFNFTESDVISVRDICLRGRSNYRGVDILATSSWPRNVTHLDTQKVPEPQGSNLLSWLAVQIKPRYHFCGLEGRYYERRPYRNHSSGDPAHATRFIALAKVGNVEKEKWLYALSIDPIDKMRAMDLYQPTTDQTECPYSENFTKQNFFTSKDEKPSQFFYDMNSTSEDGRKRQRKDQTAGGPERKQRPVFDQSTCWFCLASPEVEKHLVVSIGNEAYLALAKGGLVPEHLLILPVAHHQSLSCIPDSVRKEIRKFKSALKKYFNNQQKVPVFFERNFKTSHLQMQVVPIDLKHVNQLKNIFQELAEAEGFHLDELPEHAKLEQIAPSGTPYFYVELPSGDKLFHRIRKHFPLQFGRDVLASVEVLDMEERADWKDCVLSKDQETLSAKKFRTSFQPFDFTLQN